MPEKKCNNKNTFVPPRQADARRCERVDIGRACAVGVVGVAIPKVVATWGRRPLNLIEDEAY